MDRGARALSRRHQSLIDNTPKGNDMKITGFQTHLVRLPGAPTLADIPDKADQYHVRHAPAPDRRGRRRHRHHFLRRGAHRDLEERGRSAGALTVGEDPLRVEADRGQAARRGRAAPGRAASSRWRSPPSTSRCGTSRARRSNQPLWKLLGGFRDRVPTYASGALMRDFHARAVVRKRPEAGRRKASPDEDAARAAGRRPRRRWSWTHARSCARASARTST